MFFCIKDWQNHRMFVSFWVDHIFFVERGPEVQMIKHKWQIHLQLTISNSSCYFVITLIIYFVIYIIYPYSNLPSTINSCLLFLAVEDADFLFLFYKLKKISGEALAVPNIMGTCSYLVFSFQIESIIEEAKHMVPFALEKLPGT